jgi:hypothetical protein
MKLTDLEPRYYVREEGGHPVGITFACPHCAASGQRLAIAIHLDGTDMDPDPDNPQQWGAPETVWKVEAGDSFENLSLSPSIDAKNHWHGYITNGEITTV